MVSVRSPRELSIREWLNPLWIQHGTFVTPLSVSECERILLAHTVSRWIGHFTDPDIIQQEPSYEGRVRNGKFSLRLPTPRIKGAEPELNGTLLKDLAGTRIEVRLRVPAMEAVSMAAIGPAFLTMVLVLEDLRGSIAGGIIGLVMTCLYCYLRWSRRSEWDHYAWFIEAFLSARLVKWDSRPY